jgi:hypothetical protein
VPLPEDPGKDRRMPFLLESLETEAVGLLVHSLAQSLVTKGVVTEHSARTSAADLKLRPWSFRDA